MTASRSGEKLKHLGMELMIRWNNAAPPVPFEMAVMGHLDEEAYKFIIGRDGKTYEISVREIE